MIRFRDFLFHEFFFLLLVFVILFSCFFSVSCFRFFVVNVSGKMEK